MNLSPLRMYVCMRLFVSKKSVTAEIKPWILRDTTFRTPLVFGELKVTSKTNALIYQPTIRRFLR